jgi:hypothetical protein
VPGIPAALDEIVTRNLDFDPTRRDTDTRAFGAALAALGLTWSDAVPLTAAARAPEPSASGADATRPIH